MLNDYKKTLCLLFQVHQPYRLRAYGFFDIGAKHDYYDESLNKQIMKRVAYNCYKPANEILLRLIDRYRDAVRITFSLSGTAMDQLSRYAPDVLESFVKLQRTGNVELTGESYAHSLAMLSHPAEYRRQVAEHSNRMESCFGFRPSAFITTNLVYSDEIGNLVTSMGYKTLFTEGARQALGWKSSNHLYSGNSNPDLKLLLRNFQLSDDISLRFSTRDWNEWPLTADKFISWLNAIDQNEEIVNLFMDYGSLGESRLSGTGKLAFLGSLLEKAVKSNRWQLKTISEAAETIHPVANLSIRDVISCADQEHDLSAWLGNELQQEAFNNLYSVSQIMEECEDEELLSDWNNLQTCDHFYYMGTKSTADGAMHRYFSPYSSPFEAFVNYMNVLSDFLIRARDYKTRHDRMVACRSLSGLIIT